MIVRDTLYIDGAWVAPLSSEVLEVSDSTTEEVFATVPAGTAADIDKAVEAAARAFPSWSATPAKDRAAFLQKIAEGLQARASEMADVISHEVGMPRSLTEMLQVGLPLGEFAGNAERAATYEWQEEIGNSIIMKEPVGIVGAITPWNFPLYQISLKVAPALAAGCTIVLKPSEVAPVNGFILAEIIHEAGVPAGVFNLVTGLGSVVGEAIATHPLVDKVSFTGSTRAGKRVMELCAQTLKRVSLEMGGKSANIILEDADLDAAIPAAMFACYINSGQTCSALTRLVVPRSRLAEVEEKTKAAAEGFSPGDSLAATTRLGPLASAVQRDRVRGYIEKGISEGAKLITGGAEAPEGLDKGYFVRPTVFSEVTSDMTIAQEEIFGPVLSILPYDTEEEAIAIANDSIYGLSGGVWGSDKTHAEQVARKIRTGQVDINGGAFNPVAPFGGYKQSGVGRERGEFGLEEFLEVKSLQR
jgi:acyl-CoA reductase-like NAD-dependent aldehyde dehydrogenase